MKKFYKSAEAGTAPGGYVVRLDGKPVKTPLRAPLILQGEALARAIADEWNAQDGDIKPASMPLTQLACTMTDKAQGADRAAMTAQLCEYGGSDLVCYFATHPETLVKRQQAVWQPLIDWMAVHHGIALNTVSGIRYIDQPSDTGVKFKAVLDGLSPAAFTVVQAASAVTGSVVIGLALQDGLLTPDAAHKAACVDEHYQLETWGDDAEAQKRLAHILAELETAAQFNAMTAKA